MSTMQKTFDKKSNYERHINRKNLCQKRDKKSKHLICKH